MLLSRQDICDLQMPKNPNKKNERRKRELLTGKPNQSLKVNHNNTIL